MGDAKLVDTIGAKTEYNLNGSLQSSKRAILDSNHYSLVSGKQIASNYYGRSCSATENAANSTPVQYELWEFLNDVRTKYQPGDLPRSSIYYPDQDAGPDLVFALEPQREMSGKKRLLQPILCVVQIKTGILNEDKDIKHAIATTDVCNSYIDNYNTSKRNNIIKEVREWNAEQRRIVRIVIAIEMKSHLSE